MLTRRLIVCLDVKGGRVVKGVNFESLRDVGDPVMLAERYEQEGADEITYLDISASAEERATLLDLARRTAERLFIPLTIGGGIRSADDVGRALRAGADKVSLNTSAVERPGVLSEAAHRFGAQCIVASIDAAKVEGTYRVFVKGGREATALEAVTEVARVAGQVALRRARGGRDSAHQHRPRRRAQRVRPGVDACRRQCRPRPRHCIWRCRQCRTRLRRHRRGWGGCRPRRRHST
jgi:imidazole glycerol-phosphate synthase subunit HisF